MSRITISACLLATIALAVLVAGCDTEATSGEGASATTQPVEMTLFIRQAQPDVGSAFERGQQVRIKDTGTLLGEITDVRVDGSLIAVPDAEGDLNASRSPVLVDVYLTIRGEAEVSDAGYRFGGEYVYINNDIKYLTPFTQFGGIITEMGPVAE